MLDKWIEKLVESVFSAYMTRVEEITKARRAELEEMKFKIRTDPQHVALWFDREIEQLGSISVGDMFAKIR